MLTLDDVLQASSNRYAPVPDEWIQALAFQITGTYRSAAYTECPCCGQDAIINLDIPVNTRITLDAWSGRTWQSSCAHIQEQLHEHLVSTPQYQQYDGCQDDFEWPVGTIDAPTILSLDEMIRCLHAEGLIVTLDITTTESILRSRNEPELFAL